MKKIYLLIIFALCLNAKAQIDDHHIVVESDNTEKLDFQKCLDNWNAPWLQERIASGIEQNRKGNAKIIFTSSDGNPVQVDSLKITQISHDFLFGSKFLYKNAFGSNEKNERYEKLYNDLFNFATIPVYWYQVEPEEGVYNYSEVNQFTGYHIALDEMVKYCLANNLVMKGHPLVWERSQARWAPEDKKELTRLYRKRFEELSGRYRETIEYWDVVNEPLNRPVHKVLPDDCTNWSMKLADRYFNPDNKLGVNATTRNSWLNFYWEDSPFYLLIKNLILQGTRIDYIGMQFHLWYGRDFINGVYNGTEMTPELLFRVLDQYSTFNLPIHISEITLPVVLTEHDEEWQAVLGANYVKLFFSHPNVECITWWNLTDELAHDGKEFNGALTGENLRLKPLYHAVRNLIKEEWQTNLKSGRLQTGEFSFRSFYGNYKVSALINGKKTEKMIHLSKSGRNKFTIVPEI